ncbi:hypothetical protein SBD_0658 [Streptomyces bottropensis ATCC 25435]|uniref:Uncharacterized protein n=1 Tax=Streptomyces bottropensis ATCC 25435 TaxID=1054862 RepID=M3FY06_9ACTN|nr:hypothetical protein SBD_0658 [Streptomyces bottropensis ATCC 25435]
MRFPFDFEGFGNLCFVPFVGTTVRLHPEAPHRQKYLFPSVILFREQVERRKARTVRSGPSW